MYLEHLYYWVHMFQCFVSCQSWSFIVLDIGLHIY